MGEGGEGGAKRFLNILSRALDGNDLNFTRRLYSPLIEKAVHKELVIKFGDGIDLEQLTTEQIE